tara:strand:+ start:202 stop:414 length:213 start_codon:yes stop_codon:yes gene_type:complete
MSDHWLIRYFFLLFGCYWLGVQIDIVFFTDFVAITWFDYVGVYGLFFLMMFVTFIYWDKILPYLNKIEQE